MIILGASKFAECVGGSSNPRNCLASSAKRLRNHRAFFFEAPTMAKSISKKTASPTRTGKKRRIKKTRKSLTASHGVLDRLWIIIDNRKDVDATISHSAKLLA